MTRAALPLLALTLLAPACGGDDDATTAATSPAVVVDSSGTDGGASLGPVCDLVNRADLAALFPDATPGTPDVSTNSCSLTVSPAGGAGAFFAMMPVFTPYDDRLQIATDLGHTISQLDGIGERAYFAAGAPGYEFGEVVFEMGGVVFSVLADYALGDVAMPDAATIQDSLMRIAGTWASTL